MSINYPSFPKNINSNKINANEITSSFSGTFFGDGSGLINIASGSNQVLTTNNLTGTGVFGNALDLKQSISLFAVTASLNGNATSADFATTATSATFATSADFATIAGFSTTANTATLAFDLLTGSIPQVTAIKVNDTTYGFDTINFTGTAGFPPFIPATPAVQMVRMISGSNYDLSYGLLSIENVIGIGSSGSYTGILLQSPSSASLIAPRITISATSASTTGNTVITGSVTGSDNSYLNFQVLQLRQFATLPAGTLGMLAVSGTDLYFHNGSAWQLK